LLTRSIPASLALFGYNPPSGADFPTFSFVQNRSLEPFYGDTIPTVIAIEFHPAKCRIFGANERPPLPNVYFGIVVNLE
jgi:hypothetical protein